LGSILEEVGQAYESELGSEALESVEESAEVVEIELSIVDPNPYQPRKEFDEERLRELSDSIVRHGMIQPVVVVRSGERYILVAGERRLRAHRMAGLEKIRAIVADLDMDEIAMRELALVENIQREDLNPVDLARAYRELIEVHDITHEELSRIVHKSRSQITNTLRLLSLDHYTLEKLRDEKISQGHAKILIPLPEEERRVMVDTIVGRKLSVRDAEKMVKLKKRGDEGKKVKPSFSLESEERRRLSSLIPLKHSVKKSKVVIEIDDRESFERLLAIFEKGTQT
jgi:ParB family chromosome partitioning protein